MAHELQMILRQDFHSFVHRTFQHLNPGMPFLDTWHVELLAWEVTRCVWGESPRLIINLPPRSLKSVIVSVAMPAWILGHEPGARIICASYGQDLADKLGRDCRSVVESEWYQSVFPNTRLSMARRSVSEFETTAHGYRMATSVNGVLTGRGADYLILDDILKPDDALSDAVRTRSNEWFGGTLYSRLDDKRKGRIIIVQQRVHEADLVGHVLQQSSESWRHLPLPALAEEDEQFEIETPWGSRSHIRRAGEALHPEREPVETLAKIRRAMGEYYFAAQYQQRPAPRGGGIVKREWLKYYTEEQRPERFDRIIQSCDTANSSSQLANFTAIITVGQLKSDFYILNVLRDHLDFPALVRTIRAQQQAFAATTVVVEEAASGVQLIQQLQHDGVHWITGMKPEGDKVIRMHAQSTSFSNGFVYLPREAHWLDAYVHELTTFPYSKHSDQVDATSQALAWLRERPPVPLVVPWELEKEFSWLEFGS